MTRKLGVLVILALAPVVVWGGSICVGPEETWREGEDHFRYREAANYLAWVRVDGGPPIQLFDFLPQPVAEVTPGQHEVWILDAYGETKVIRFRSHSSESQPSKFDACIWYGKGTYKTAPYPIDPSGVACVCPRP